MLAKRGQRIQFETPDRTVEGVLLEDVEDWAGRIDVKDYQLGEISVDGQLIFDPCVDGQELAED